jgi:antitoxin HicB
VQFVDLPDTFTEGDTLEEAQFNAVEVLSAMLECKLEEGAPISAPSVGLTGKRIHYIAPDAKTQGVLLLRQARGERSLADLARAMQTSWPQAKRLEDPMRWLDSCADIASLPLSCPFGASSPARGEEKETPLSPRGRGGGGEGAYTPEPKTL